MNTNIKNTMKWILMGAALSFCIANKAFADDSSQYNPPPTCYTVCTPTYGGGQSCYTICS